MIFLSIIQCQYLKNSDPNKQIIYIEDEIDFNESICLNNFRSENKIIFYPAYCNDFVELNLAGIIKFIKPKQKLIVKRPSLLSASSLSSLESSLRRMSTSSISNSTISYNIRDALNFLVQEQKKKFDFTSVYVLKNLESNKLDFNVNTDKNKSFFKKLGLLNQDLSLVKHCIHHSQRTNELSLLSDFKNIEMRLNHQLSDLGNSMASIALAKNIRFAQYDEILKTLKMKSNGGANDELIRYFEQAIKEKNINPENVSSIDLKNKIYTLLDEEPMAMLSRATGVSSASKIIFGYPGKPLKLKMKSRPENGFIPVNTEFSSKINQLDMNEVSKYSGYSMKAMNEIQQDGLPVSIGVPRFHDLPIKNIDDIISLVRVYEAKIKRNNEEVITWLDEEELNSNPNAVKILYHAEPRALPGVTREVINDWNVGTKEALKNISPSQRVDIFLDHINELRAKKGDPKISLLDAPLFVSDIDLSSIATKRTKHNEEIVNKMSTSEGFYGVSHESIMKHKNEGFSRLGMQNQVRHGPELYNSFAPQELKKDYPLRIVYSRSKKIDESLGFKGDAEDYKPGDFVSEEIKISNNPHNPHEYLFKKIMQIYKANDLNILMNPADIVVNFKDYVGSVMYWIPEQKRLVKKFVDNIKSDPNSDIAKLYLKQINELGDKLEKTWSDI